LALRVFAFVFSSAASLWGPVLCGLGMTAILVGGVVHGIARRPTILHASHAVDDLAPNIWERLSVHLVIYAVWALVFGMIVWRGVPAGMIDVRLQFERDWPVVENAEWIYASVYLVPLLLPWLPVSRGALRRYALHLWWLLAISVVIFLVLPLGAPPRAFAPTSWAGRLLAWETGRGDFAAASLPSFHVIWGVLAAQLLATLGRSARWIGWGWAVAVAVACIATGAHAIADVAASGILLAVFGKLRAGAWAGQTARARAALREPNSQPMPTPAASPTTSAPRP
jgi:hypothetical protein